MMTKETVLTEIEACKQVCIQCQDTCLDTINYCKTLNNTIDMNLVCMMRDCAEMCMMCVNLITDGSEFMGRTCQLCAEMCLSTAMLCDMSNDPTIKDCATICRQCAESCKTLGFQSSSYFRRENTLSLDNLSI